MKRKWLVLFACVALLVLALWVIRLIPFFQGERVANSDVYALDFSLMNRTDTHNMNLSAGDTLSVSFDISRGEVNLLIASETNRLYKGDKIDSGKFVITVPESGTYQMTVQASFAKGTVQIKKNHSALK